VDPKILGGVIYQIGDLLLDVSFHTLQSEFFQELENAGIKPIF
jgi:F0F1-type ATP synthase delta subunit